MNAHELKQVKYFELSGSPRLLSNKDHYCTEQIKTGFIIEKKKFYTLMNAERKEGEAAGLARGLEFSVWSQRFLHYFFIGENPDTFFCYRLLNKEGRFVQPFVEFVNIKEAFEYWSANVENKK